MKYDVEVLASNLFECLLHSIYRTGAMSSNYYLPPAGQEIIKRIPCVCSCVIVCHAFIKGCTSHWLFLLGLFNVFYDLIAYVLSFDAVISHLGP